MGKASPFTAVAMLLMFKQQRVTLTESQFDLYVGTIVELLEEVHDDRYLLEKEERDTWPTDASAIQDEPPATSAPVFGGVVHSKPQPDPEHGK